MDLGVKNEINSKKSEKIKINPVEISEVKPVKSGDRCLIDLISNFGSGEGMLIGMLSKGLFLVLSEAVEVPLIKTLSFRISAGPASQYVLVRGGKIKYILDLHGGDEVLAVDYRGKTRRLFVGRNRIEVKSSLYPFLLVRARYADSEFYASLPDEETTMLVNQKGQPVHARTLVKGDKVLACVENLSVEPV